MISVLNRCILTVLFIIPSFAFAQEEGSDFYTGYIVNSEGDTISGQVLKKNKYINPETVFFRDVGEWVEYSKQDIRAFYIAELDLLFESHKISINKNSNQKDPIEDELNGEIETGRYFVLTLASAQSYGVYSFFDEEGTNRLYFRSGDQLEELLIFKTYVSQDGRRYIRRNERYKVQLLGLMIDCPAMKNQVEATNYSSKSIAALLKTYAACKGDVLTYQSAKKKRKVSLGLMAGIGTVVKADASRTVDAGVINRTIANSELDQGRWFEFGLAIQIEPQRDKRFTYRGELKLRTQNVETKYSGPRETNRVAEATYNFKNTHLLLHILMNFNLAQWEKGNLFVEGGAYIGSALSGSIDWEQGTSQFNGDLVFREGTFDIVVQQTVIGASVGLGVQMNRFTASARYNTSLADEASDERVIVLTVGTVTLNLSYTPW